MTRANRCSTPVIVGASPTILPGVSIMVIRQILSRHTALTSAPAAGLNQNKNMTQDVGFNLKWEATDRLRFNFDAQYVELRNRQLRYLGRAPFVRERYAGRDRHVSENIGSAVPTNINQSEGGLANPNNWYLARSWTTSRRARVRNRDSGATVSMTSTPTGSTRSSSERATPIATRRSLGARTTGQTSRTPGMATNRPSLRSRQSYSVGFVHGIP